MITHEQMPILETAIADWEAATGMRFHAKNQADVSSLIRQVVDTPAYEIVSRHFTTECPDCRCRVLPGGEDRHSLLHR